MPLIEIADDTDTPGIRCPGGKAHPCDTFMFTAVGAEDTIDMFVLTLAKQMQIEVSDGGTKAVGIMALPPAALAGVPAQLVLWCLFLRQAAGKEIGTRQTLHGPAVAGDHHRGVGRAGQQGTDVPLFALLVATEDFERIMMTSREEPLHVLWRGLSGQNRFHLVSTDLYQLQKQEISLLRVHNVTRW
jgi:hypothetical protein